jgi:hypothetical protein
MKFMKWLVVAMSGFCVSVITGHATLILNFSSTIGSAIQFNGTDSSFQFDSSTVSGPFLGSQWQIGSESGGDGSALGLLGSFGNNTFSYGPITTIISGSDIDESATVTGPLSALVINDGSGNLTGTIDWVQIATHDFGGVINAGVTINVTGLAYAGTNADLLTLLADGSGALDLTFQFSPGETLSDLTTGSGPYDTSYSGSLSVPESTSAGFLLLTGLGALICFQRLTLGDKLSFKSQFSKKSRTT